VSGLWLLAFIVIHVRTFRFGAHYQTAEGITDLYRIEMETFASPLTVGFYAVSMLIVGSHLWHGASSAFQSLGLSHPRWTPRLLAAGKAFAVLIAGGFIAIALWAHLVGGRQ
jgi:succinate dehydrogenase / fumarate reductase cytochrome b subunit